MCLEEVVSRWVIMMSDKPHRLRTLHIFNQIVDVERPCGVDPELSARQFKDAPLGFHHAGFVGINPVHKETLEKLIFFKNVIVMDAADV